MINMIEMDRTTTFLEQLEEAGVGPIMLFNHFHVPAEHNETFLELWRKDAAFMLGKGCTSGQLHKGVGGSSSYINMAVWESAETLSKAFRDPAFRELLSEYPDECSATPHLFRKIAVDGICTA